MLDVPRAATEAKRPAHHVWLVILKMETNVKNVVQIVLNASQILIVEVVLMDII